MKVKRILNSSESATLNELNKAFEGTGYRIFPQQLINKVIALQASDLKHSDRSMYNTGTFDFVVCDSNQSPQFAVEFDGPSHLLYPRKREKDIRKNRICSIAQFPLLRISDPELDRYDSISIVEFIAYRFLNWMTSFPRIQQEIQSEVDLMTREEIKHLTRGGVLDPSIDPSFRFDLEFPFPLTRDVQVELANVYKLGLHLPSDENDSPLWFSVSPNSSFPDKGSFFSSCGYGVYRGKTSDGHYSWKGSHLTSASVEILLEGSVRFGMRWALITAEDYDEAEAPVSYAERTGHLPIYFGDIPGGNIPSICEAVSEYIAYKKVKEWAQNRLESR